MFGNHPGIVKGGQRVHEGAGLRKTTMTLRDLAFSTARAEDDAAKSRFAPRDPTGPSPRVVALDCFERIGESFARDGFT